MTNFVDTREKFNLGRTKEARYLRINKKIPPAKSLQRETFLPYPYDPRNKSKMLEVFDDCL